MLRLNFIAAWEKALDLTLLAALAFYVAKVVCFLFVDVASAVREFSSMLSKEQIDQLIGLRAFLKDPVMTTLYRSGLSPTGVAVSFAMMLVFGVSFASASASKWRRRAALSLGTLLLIVSLALAQARIVANSRAIYLHLPPQQHR